MRHRSLSIGTFAAGLLVGATAALAGNESWVSGNGTDSGSCPRTAPCRTFQFAHDQTNNHGAINVLTSGNFGPLTITKPISIVAEGVEAVINTAANGAAITVQAGPAHIISLRGLTIDLRGTANNGIFFSTGGALHVQNCVIRRSSTGINVQPIGNVEVYIADSVVADTTSVGIFFTPGEDADIVIDRVRVENANGNGIQFNRGSVFATTATVRDSVVAGNNGNGIGAFGTAGSINVTVSRTTSANNDTGIDFQGVNTIARIGNSTVTGNLTHGLNTGAGPGQIVSYGTNRIDGNNGNETPSSTIALK